ncbi:prolyl 3-hydroxylase 1-like isoform X2 [Mya arenaria]|uniref:prolyl 3-hydroxylase 1-like isoform X2 n=1 Tax=Mya arenaria TaxID=6604 RepID=UPI0022E3711B|nr:prolyl 3-hydroxylase 1-like isoform X2 [Mya arenaria]
MKMKLYVTTIMELSIILFFSLNIYCVLSLKHDQLTNYEKLYEMGMEAYKKGKWSECSSLFSSAVKDYHFYHNTLIDCRMKCYKNDTSSILFDTILEKGNCLRHCKKKLLGLRAEEETSYAIQLKFEDRNPYNYMSFCFYKDEKYKEAASAAFTYYVSHQDDERITESVHYYRGLSGIENLDFVDLERKLYQSLYIKGLNAYNVGDWEEASSLFERSLQDYFREEERCRFGCEKGFVHGMFPDFINAIADHYVAVLVCKQKCLKKLATFGMDEVKDYVLEHFNYLQYAYYQSGKFEEAFEAIANFLLFKSTDEMLNNKKYYITTLGHSPNSFKPTPAVKQYVEMWQAIDHKLDFVREHYILSSDFIAAEDSKDQDIWGNQIDTGQASRKENVAMFESIGMRLKSEGKDLNGEDRFVADSFIREDQCQTLTDLAMAKPGDDNGVKKVNISEATKLVSENEDLEMSLRLLLRAHVLMSSYVAAYFSRSGLRVADITLVCRHGGEQATKGKSLSEDCVPQEDGSCLGKDWKDRDQVTVVAYLTDNTEGTGEFYFMGHDGDVQSKVEPECGKLVGFTGESHHGVSPAWDQERCALVLTLSEYRPKAQGLDDAKKFLQKLDSNRNKGFPDSDTTDILNQFYSQGVKITQKDDELLGKERFVADDLSTPVECDQLIAIAKKEGIGGDGYAGRSSPHSDAELFTGVSILHAYKLAEKGRISPSSLRLLLDVSENARLLVERYLRLPRPLYFDYTHLVCRTAIPGAEGELSLSHPVHADNCVIQDDGSCIRDPLAYTQRSYSAVLYLNDDFEGGEFFFAHKNKSEQISVSPVCGRLVAFNAGEFHGVKAVTSGQRCAIAMWFTHDPNFQEVARLHASRRIDKLFKPGDKMSEQSESESQMEGAILNHEESLTDDPVSSVSEDKSDLRKPLKPDEQLTYPDMSDSSHSDAHSDSTLSDHAKGLPDDLSEKAESHDEL